MLFKKDFLRTIFLFVFFLVIFFSNFSPIIIFTAYNLENLDTANRSQNEETTVITSNDTEIRNGNYSLIAKNELNYVYISVSPECSNGLPNINLMFNYTKNVTFSVSFSMVFLGSEQINNSDLVIAALPITISCSSEFSNWTISTPIVSNRYQKDSVAFYYITSRDFIRFEPIYYKEWEQYTFSGEFQGNGTYAFLGIMKEPQPFWTAPFFYISLGLFAVQLVVIALIIKFVTGFIFGKNE